MKCIVFHYLCNLKISAKSLNFKAEKLIDSNRNTLTEISWKVTAHNKLFITERSVVHLDEQQQLRKVTNVAYINSSKTNKGL